MDETLPEKRSYRQLIKAIVEQKNQGGKGMSFSKLATQTKIQRSYLSQVINLKHHLSNDQLFAICQALHLPTAVKQHLLLLSEWERCKLDPRKRELERQLEKLEATHELLASEPDDAKQDALDDYFCDPLAEVVLKFLSMEAFRKNPAAIQERLGAGPKRWREILDTLRDSGFIAFTSEDAIQLLKTPVFPSEQSAAEKIRNIQGRMKVANQKLKQRYIDEFLYNWWFLSNPERKRQLKIEYLHLLQDIYRESLTVPHEDVYQLSIDLFSP